MEKQNAYASVQLNIKGMTWMGWEPKVVNALEGLSGIEKTVASFAEKNVVVRYDSTAITLDQIFQALLKAGYVASIAESDKQASDNFNPLASGKTVFQTDDLVCFCFGYTRNDIEQDYINNGQSLIMARIASEKKAGGCDCAVKNPKGLWCLSDVRQVVDEVKKERTV